MVRGFRHRALRRFARDNVNEVLLHWLGREHHATQVLLRTHKPRTPAPAAWEQFRRGNVVGIGFGAKESGGKLTGELAVRIYVRKKHARGKLSARDCAPKTVGGMATDIVALGMPVFHARPVEYGAGIGHANGGGGTLTCVVTRPGDSARYILSASHVFSPGGTARQGDEIVEPSRPDPTATRIAALTEFVQLAADGSPNSVDAAIARLDHDADVLPTISIIGKPRSDPLSPVPFQSLRKFGAETFHTVGVVCDIAAQKTLIAAGGSYVFSDIIVVKGAGEPFSAGGDSGALAVDAMTNRPVGLVIGGGEDDLSFLTPIALVLRKLQVEILT